MVSKIRASVISDVLSSVPWKNSIRRGTRRILVVGHKHSTRVRPDLYIYLGAVSRVSRYHGPRWLHQVVELVVVELLGGVAAVVGLGLCVGCALHKLLDTLGALDAAQQDEGGESIAVQREVPTTDLE